MVRISLDSNSGASYDGDGYVFLANNIIKGQAYNLKGFRGEVREISPWPPGYPLAIALWKGLPLTANLDERWLTVLFIGAAIGACLRLQKTWLALTLLCEQAQFSFLHTWSEALLLPCMLVFFSLNTNKAKYSYWLMMALSIFMGQLRIATAFFMAPIAVWDMRFKGIKVALPMLAGLSFLGVFLTWQHFSTGYLTGGPRPISNQSGEAWLGANLIDNAFLWLPLFVSSSWFSLAVIAALALLIKSSLTVPQPRSGNQALLAGICYLAAISLLHYRFVFAEGLDGRLLAPGLFSIWVWALGFSPLKDTTVCGFATALCLLQLPWAAMLALFSA